MSLIPKYLSEVLRYRAAAAEIREVRTTIIQNADQILGTVTDWTQGRGKVGVIYPLPAAYWMNIPPAPVKVAKRYLVPVLYPVMTKKSGVRFSCGVDYENLTENTADLVLQFLEDKEPPLFQEKSCKLDAAVMYLNQDMAQEFGIAVPQKILVQLK